MRLFLLLNFLGLPLAVAAQTIGAKPFVDPHALEVQVTGQDPAAGGQLVVSLLRWHRDFPQALVVRRGIQFRTSFGADGQSFYFTPKQGRYVVLAFQDLNQDGVLNLGPDRQPIEPYGLSNGAPYAAGKSSFERGSVRYEGSRMQVMAVIRKPGAQ